jgi:hypothetical protein
LNAYESVTVACTKKLPAALGAHESIGVFADEHPAGRPEYEYARGAVPPATETVKFVVWPMSNASRLALKLVTIGAAFTRRAVLLETDQPTESVARTWIVNVPLTRGRQVRFAVLALLHPPGSPLYPYAYGGDPPVTETERVVFTPVVTAAGETV